MGILDELRDERPDRSALSRFRENEAQPRVPPPRVPAPRRTPDSTRDPLAGWRKAYTREHRGTLPGGFEHESELEAVANMLRSRDADRAGEFGPGWWERNYYEHQQRRTPEYQRYLDQARDLLGQSQSAREALRRAQQQEQVQPPSQGRTAPQGGTQAQEQYVIREVEPGTGRVATTPVPPPDQQQVRTTPAPAGIGPTRVPPPEPEGFSFRVPEPLTPLPRGERPIDQWIFPQEEDDEPTPEELLARTGQWAVPEDVPLWRDVLDNVLHYGTAAGMRSTEAAARAAQGLGRGLQPQEQGERPIDRWLFPEGQQPVEEPVINRNLAAPVAQRLSDTLRRGGRAVEEHVAPENQPFYRPEEHSEFLTETAEDIGSTGPYILASAAGGGVPAIAALGGLQGYESTYREAEEAGVSEEEATAAARAGAAVGTTEGLLDIAIGGGASTPLRSMLKSISIEAGQETFAQTMQNLVAQHYYEPDRPLTAGLARAARSGGIVAAILGLPTAVDVATRPDADAGDVHVIDDDPSNLPDGAKGLAGATVPRTREAAERVITTPAPEPEAEVEPDLEPGNIPIYSGGRLVGQIPQSEIQQAEGESAPDQLTLEEAEAAGADVRPAGRRSTIGKVVLFEDADGRLITAEGEPMTGPFAQQARQLPYVEVLPADRQAWQNLKEDFTQSLNQTLEQRQQEELARARDVGAPRQTTSERNIEATQEAYVQFYPKRSGDAPTRQTPWGETTVDKNSLPYMRGHWLARNIEAGNLPQEYGRFITRTRTGIPTVSRGAMRAWPDTLKREWVEHMQGRIQEGGGTVPTRQAPRPLEDLVAATNRQLRKIGRDFWTYNRQEMRDAHDAILSLDAELREHGYGLEFGTREFADDVALEIARRMKATGDMQERIELQRLAQRLDVWNAVRRAWSGEIAPRPHDSTRINRLLDKAIAGNRRAIRDLTEYAGRSYLTADVVDLYNNQTVERVQPEPEQETPQAEPETQEQPPEATAPETTYAFGANPNNIYEFTYKVVPLDSLITSHNEGGRVNPEFPQELQPRGRERAASRVQIERIARQLAPRALVEDSAYLDRGAPIVGGDNVVEAGNGRTQALRVARNSVPEKWEDYREALYRTAPEYGITTEEIDAIDDPVLVRERVTDVDREAFVREANQRNTMAMAPSEVAREDARRITDEMVLNLQQGSSQSLGQALISSTNKPFFDRFLGKMDSQEASELLDAGGQNINGWGIQRAKSGLFAYTYEGESARHMSEAFIEEADPDFKNIQNAIYDSLVDVAQAEALTRSGARDADLSIADDIGRAVNALNVSRQRDISVDELLRQGTLEAEQALTDTQRDILRFLDNNIRSRKRIREFLQAYAQGVKRLPDARQGGMFEAETATKEELVQRATQEEAGEAADAQRSFFQEGDVPDTDTALGERSDMGAETATGQAGLFGEAGRGRVGSALKTAGRLQTVGIAGTALLALAGIGGSDVIEWEVEDDGTIRATGPLADDIGRGLRQMGTPAEMQQSLLSWTLDLLSQPGHAIERAQGYADAALIQHGSTVTVGGTIDSIPGTLPDDVTPQEAAQAEAWFRTMATADDLTDQEKRMWNAVMRIHYSGYVRQKRAFDELMRLDNPSEAQITAILKRHENPATQLVGQILMDPLNVLSVGAVLALPARIAGTLPEGARLGLMSWRQYSKARAAIARSLGAADELDSSTFWKITSRLGDVIRTREGRAVRIASNAVSDMEPQLMQAETIDELGELLGDFWYRRTVPAGKWIDDAKLVSAFKAHVAETGGDIVKARELAAKLIYDNAKESAAAVLGRDVLPVRAAEKASRWMKDRLSTLLLKRNPGYLGPNVVNNLVTAAIDGSLRTWKSVTTSLPVPAVSLPSAIPGVNVDEAVIARASKIIDDWWLDAGKGPGFIPHLADEGYDILGTERALDVESLNAKQVFTSAWQTLHERLWPEAAHKAVSRFGNVFASPQHADELAHVVSSAYSPQQMMDAALSWADDAGVNRTQVRQFVDNVLTPAMRHTQAGVTAGAWEARVQAMLNYSDRTVIDGILEIAKPYHFWYTRSIINWGIRALDRPEVVANFARVDSAIRDGLNNSGIAPEWLRQHPYVSEAIVDTLLPGNFMTGTMDSNERAYISLVDTFIPLRSIYGIVGGDTFERELPDDASALTRFAVTLSEDVPSSDNPFLVAGIALADRALDLGLDRDLYEASIPLWWARPLRGLTAANREAIRERTGLDVGPTGVDLSAYWRQVLGYDPQPQYEEARRVKRLADRVRLGELSIHEAREAVINEELGRESEAYEEATYWTTRYYGDRGTVSQLTPGISVSTEAHGEMADESAEYWRIVEEGADEYLIGLLASGEITYDEYKQARTAGKNREENALWDEAQRYGQQQPAAQNYLNEREYLPLYWLSNDPDDARAAGVMEDYFWSTSNYAKRDLEAQWTQTVESAAEKRSRGEPLTPAEQAAWDAYEAGHDLRADIDAAYEGEATLEQLARVSNVLLDYTSEHPEDFDRRQAEREIKAQVQEEFPNFDELEDEYYSIDDPEQRRQFARDSGLRQMWAREDELRAQHGDLFATPPAVRQQQLEEHPPSQAQIDLARSLGIDPRGKTSYELSEEIDAAGGPDALPPSEAQVGYARDIGIDTEGMNRAEVGRAINERHVRAAQAVGTDYATIKPIRERYQNDEWLDDDEYRLLMDFYGALYANERRSRSGSRILDELR